MKTIVLFDFNKSSNIKDWNVVNDVVMGGRSSSTFSINDEGMGVFKGNVSLENNGGFSSLRYSFEELSISEFTKVVIRLQGDNKQYQFRIKSNSKDYYSYIAPFSTSGEWEEIEISLKDMYPSFRGRRLNMPSFSNNLIEEISFLIGNKKNEDFQLIIDKIELRS